MEATQCLVDTNIIVDLLRGREPVVSKLRQMIAGGGSVYYSPVCIAEIYVGVKPSEEAQVASFFGALACVPINEEIGVMAGRIMQKYDKSHGLELADALLAATAIVTEMPLWTNNRKHFPSPGIVFYAGKDS